MNCSINSIRVSPDLFTITDNSGALCSCSLLFRICPTFSVSFRAPYIVCWINIFSVYFLGNLASHAAKQFHSSGATLVDKFYKKMEKNWEISPNSMDFFSTIPLARKMVLYWAFRCLRYSALLMPHSILKPSLMDFILLQ